MKRSGFLKTLAGTAGAILAGKPIVEAVRDYKAYGNDKAWCKWIKEHSSIDPYTFEVLHKRYRDEYLYSMKTGRHFGKSHARSTNKMAQGLGLDLSYERVDHA